MFKQISVNCVSFFCLGSMIYTSVYGDNLIDMLHAKLSKEQRVKMLFEAMASENTERLHHLIRTYPKLIFARKDGETALLKLAQLDNHTIPFIEKNLTFLLDHGASVDELDDGCHWTPLLRMLSYRNIPFDFIRILAVYRADIRQNIDNKTPLALAARNGRSDIVSFLLGLGVDKNVKNSEGKTAADLAAENDYIDLANFIYYYGLMRNNNNDMKQESGQANTK